MRFQLAPFFIFGLSCAFQPLNIGSPSKYLRAKRPNEDEASPSLKAAWILSEMVGKAGGMFRRQQKGHSECMVSSVPPVSFAETARRLKKDYDRNYFVSGKIDEQLYAPDCVFSDPFVSFVGRKRFIENLQNLGSFISGYDIRMISFEESLSSNPPIVTTRLMVKLQLNLPWHPVLAWPWGVCHELDPSSFQIIVHRESWEVTAVEGLQQLFRSASPSVLKRINRET